MSLSSGKSVGQTNNVCKQLVFSQAILPMVDLFFFVVFKAFFLFWQNRLSILLGHEPDARPGGEESCFFSLPVGFGES